MKVDGSRVLKERNIRVNKSYSERASSNQKNSELGRRLLESY